MKISRISPFVVAPAADHDIAAKEEKSKAKKIKAESLSSFTKDAEDSSKGVSELELVRRKRENEKRKQKEKLLRKKRGLKNYARFIHEEAEGLMKDNFKRKA